MDFLERLGEITGDILTGDDAARYGRDWVGTYVTTPLAVVRPSNTPELSAIMALAHEMRVPVVPLAGNTGLTGGGSAEGALVVSVERMNRVRDINPSARVVTVEAGVILSDLHDAVGDVGMIYPMTFGAKGSARIGGTLATNAGGSNVLRYGNTRDLCLGIEAVLTDGRVVDLMGELHKDNSGYDLRDLLIGSEGTLAIITAAVLKLYPAPRARATAMVSVPDLDAALALLNQLQEDTSGAVEAFEYMPRDYMVQLRQHRPDLTPPLGYDVDHTVFLEIATTRAGDAQMNSDGVVPLSARLEETLGAMFEAGHVIDAAMATSEGQRLQMWEMREAAAEITTATKPLIICDLSLPRDRAADFLREAKERLSKRDENIRSCTVAHLGDGNIHFTLYPSSGAPDHCDALVEIVEDIVREMGGSFSAEHGIGVAKLSSMRRRKDPVALDMMRAIKAALDPRGILNPGKTVP
ncbi:FAD-binding oxidoreductase [Celeribacter arenosi]|uniref:FAD-binding oxidoreductase n=1 Tax=Celeribacter arenosi TaxID=792649 RepID=A0ABP7K129_9RHOB